MSNLAAFIPVDRRLALIKNQTLPNRTTGTALFADISGFTPLTGALAEEFGRKRGAETVLTIINPIYNAIISTLHEHGGSVIGFGGDSITCWFDGDLAFSAQQAAACAIDMQAKMRTFSIIRRPNGNVVELAIKVALACGPARRFVIGDPQYQLFDVLAGETLQRMALAEGFADRGDIILSREVVDHLPSVKIAEWRNEFAVLDAFNAKNKFAGWGLDSAESPKNQLPQFDTITPNRAQPWIIPAIFDRLTTGGAYLGELRPATALFMRFSGIDYDQDEEAGAKFDAFIRRVQRVLNRYHGTLIQLTVGDKGNFLYAAFGAPNTTGDDTTLALASALDLQEVPPHLDYVQDIQIGLSRGQIWSGACGADDRHTFGVMGAEVNMAARLMAKAKPGQTLVNRVLLRETDAYEFDLLDPIKVKGREKPLPIAALLGRSSKAGHQILKQFSLNCVGRNNEIETIQKVAQQSAENGKFVQISGEAGIGKSHLAATIIQNFAHKGWQIATALCQSISRTTLYYPWQQLLTQLLSLPQASSSGQQANQQGEQIAILNNKIEAINADWLLRLPLLGDLFGLPIEDNPTTAAFDPQLRQASLFALVVDLIQHFSADSPLLLFIDDADWSDEASQKLIDAVANGTQDNSVLLLICNRPSERLTLNFQDRHLFALGPLGLDGATQLAKDRVSAEISPILGDFIWAQAHGNPHFSGELITNLIETNQVRKVNQQWDISAEFQTIFHEHGLIQQGSNPPRLMTDADFSQVQLDIPDSVQQLVLSRLDRLSEKVKLTLKVASVLGRIIDVDMMAAIHPVDYARQQQQQLQSELGSLKSADFLVERDDVSFIFKHATTYDVVYDTLLFSQRHSLHQAVIDWYEQKFSVVDLASLTNQSALAPYFGELYFHAQRAENFEKERIFAQLAGNYAASTYANTQAAAYLTRALELTPAEKHTERFDLILVRESVYDWLGEREKQSADLDALADLAKQLDQQEKLATVHLRQGNYHRWLGQYDNAVTQVVAAEKLSRENGYESMVSQAVFMQGRLERIQRNYSPAEKHLTRAFELAQRQEDSKMMADCLLDIGSVNSYLGKFQDSLAYYEKAHQLYQDLDERKDEAGALVMFGLSLTYLGDYVKARNRLENALEICRSIGYRVGEGNILGNIAVNYEFLGQYEEAIDLQNQSLAVSRSLHDVEGESFALSNLTLLYYLTDDVDSAETVAKEAIAHHHQLNDSRSEAFTLTYLGHALTKAHRFADARAAYQKAIKIRQSLGEEHLTIDDLAGLAEIALLENEQLEARQFVKQILDWVGENGVDSVEYPLQVYWTCYKVLAKSEPAAARLVLKDAYDVLKEKINFIQDPAVRERYLTNVSANRLIHKAYQLNFEFLS